MIKLEGTEKQIKWAESIREKLIKDLEENKSFIEERLNELTEKNMVEKGKIGKRTQRLIDTYEELKNVIEKETSAKRYIEEYKNVKVYDYIFN